MRLFSRGEIIWNIINSGLAGALVFLGSLTSGTITAGGIAAGLIAASIVAISKFRDFWQQEEKGFSKKAFSFF